MSDFPQSSFTGSPQKDQREPDYLKGPPVGGQGGADIQPKESAIANLPKATTLQRIIALVIDAIVWTVLILIGLGVMLASTGDTLIKFVATLGQVTFEPRWDDVNRYWQTLTANSGFWVGLALALLSPTLYYLITVSTGRTIGNRIARYRLVDANGKAPGLGRALVRWIVELVGGLLFAFTYLWLSWDGKGQTLHDRAAGVYAVSTKDSPTK